MSFPDKSFQKRYGGLQGCVRSVMWLGCSDTEVKINRRVHTFKRAAFFFFLTEKPLLIPKELLCGLFVLVLRFVWSRCLT